MAGRTRRDGLRGVLAAAVLLLGAGLGYAVVGGATGEPDRETAARRPAAARTPTSTGGRAAPATGTERTAAATRRAPPAAAVLAYYARRAAGDRRGSAALVAPGAIGVPDFAAGAGDALEAAHGAAAEVDGTEARATVTFRPWMVVRRRTGCAQYPAAVFIVVRAGGTWRVAGFPELADRAEPCDCADSPWPATPPPDGPGRSPDTAGGGALPLRELRTGVDFYAEAAPAGWPTNATRPPLDVDGSGAVRWDELRAGARDIGFPLRARDVNVHVLLRRPAELGCVAFALERRPAGSRLSVTVTPDRTEQHVTVFLPYRDGFHWSRQPLRRADGVTLHVNGLPADAALPALRFRLYASPAPSPGS